jgi:hypothetical protein
LYILTGKEPQALAARGFQVEQRNIVVDHFDAPYPGGNLLSWNLFAALGFLGLEDYIGNCGMATHQDMTAIFFLLAYHIIMVPDLADLTGDYSCQALTAIAVTATIAESQA